MAAVYENYTDSESEVDSERSDNSTDGCDLNLDFEVSDYEVGDEETGIRPYQYEPEYSASDSDTPNSDEDVDQTDQDRLHTLQWYLYTIVSVLLFFIYTYINLDKMGIV